MEKSIELEVLILMRRADLEISNANLCITEGNYSPDQQQVHLRQADAYLDDASKLIHDCMNQVY